MKFPAALVRARSQTGCSGRPVQQNIKPWVSFVQTCSISPISQLQRKNQLNQSKSGEKMTKTCPNYPAIMQCILRSLILSSGSFNCYLNLKRSKDFQFNLDQKQVNISLQVPVNIPAQPCSYWMSSRQTFRNVRSKWRTLEERTEKWSHGLAGHKKGDWYHYLLLSQVVICIFLCYYPFIGLTIVISRPGRQCTEIGVSSQFDW